MGNLCLREKKGEEEEGEEEENTPLLLAQESKAGKS